MAKLTRKKRSMIIRLRRKRSKELAHLKQRYELARTDTERNEVSSRLKKFAPYLMPNLFFVKK